MDNRKMVTHSMQGVFVFVLLGLFAVMSTLMVLLGAQMYRNTVDLTTHNNQSRLLGAYVRSMVRGEDAEQSVTAETYDGLKVLALHETIDDSEYVTWLYCYDGHLYEQFTGAGRDFNPDAGTPICEAQAFSARVEDGQLIADMVNSLGEVENLRVALRCAQ